MFVRGLVDLLLNGALVHPEPRPDTGASFTPRRH
jgi:hypothetical protein